MLIVILVNCTHGPAASATGPFACRQATDFPGDPLPLGSQGRDPAWCAPLALWLGG